MVDIIRRVTIQGRSEGLDKTAADLRNVAAAQKQVASASQATATITDMSSRKTLSAAQAYERLRRSIDPVYGAQQKLVVAERTLSRAVDQGLISLARKNELLALAAKRHGEAAAATALHERALIAFNAHGGIAVRAVLSGVGLAGGTGAAGLAGVLAARTFITNTIEQQKALAQTEATIRSTGGAAGFTAAELAKMATEMQRLTTFDDEAVLGAEALLLSFTRIGHDVFPRATAAILDTATALHTDLDAATKLVGRALNDPIKGITALAKAGVTFTATQKETIKSMIEGGHAAAAHALILKELETRFGGSAAAARDTLGGALTALKNSFGDLFEVGGPAAQRLTDSINDLVDIISDPATISAVQNLGAALFDAFSGSLDDLKQISFIVKSLGSLSLQGLKDVAPLLVRTGNATSQGDYQRTLLKAGVTRQPRMSDVNRDVEDTYDALGFPKPPKVTVRPPAFGPTDEMIKKGEQLRKQFDDLAKSTAKQTNALEAQAGALGKGVGASAQYTKQQELLNLAEQNHLKLSPVDIRSIDALAEAYGRATQKLAEMKTLRDLEFERGQIGRSGTEQNVASTLRGIYGDDWQKESNGAIANQIRLNAALETGRDIAKDFASSFITDLQSGKSVIDSLGGALDQLQKKLLDMALDQAINGLFGALAGALGRGGGVSGLPTWGGPRAMGGNVEPGSAYQVGERGPEIFVPRSAGSIQANDNRRPNLNVTVNNAPGIVSDVRQSEDGGVEINTNLAQREQADRRARRAAMPRARKSR